MNKRGFMPCWNYVHPISKYKGQHPLVRSMSLGLLHDRSLVNLARAENVVEETEDNCTDSPDHAEVHCLNIHHPRSRPKRKEDGNGHVNQSPGVYDNSPNTRKMERSPHQSRAGGVDNS